MSKSVKSQQIRWFRFWLDQDLQDGLQYQQELFQRICTLEYSQRRQLHQQAVQFARQGADTLVTCDDTSCHLWLNLKHKVPQQSLLGHRFKDDLPKTPEPAASSPHQLSEHGHKKSL